MAKQTLPRITLYSSPNCGHCRQIKAHLLRLKIPFQDFDISRNNRAQNEFQRLGARGVPLLLIGEKRLDGYEPHRLEKLLRSCGLMGDHKR